MPLRSDWSSSLCPIAHAADVLADAWVLLILRELFSGRSRFDELRKATGAADSVLARRLRTMVDERLIIRGGDGSYRLTERACAALPILHAYASFTRTTAPDGEWGMEVSCRRCLTSPASGDWCPTCRLPLDVSSTVWSRRSMGGPFALAKTAAVA